jgi:transketolase
MGMAAIGVALWKYVMKYSPSNPNRCSRDRFVLSNGESVNKQIKEKAAVTNVFNQDTLVYGNMHSCIW